MSEAPKPCPKCGNLPEIDRGLSDAPFPPGEELVQCMTVIVAVPGIPDQSCGVSSIGVKAWNYRPAEGK